MESAVIAALWLGGCVGFVVGAIVAGGVLLIGTGHGWHAGQHDA